MVAIDLAEWRDDVSDWWRKDVMDRLFESGRLQLAILVGCYMAVVYLTNRILIASPARLRLEQAIEAEKTLCEIKSTTDAKFKPFAEEIKRYAENGLDAISVKRRGGKRSPHPAITLAKVHNGRRYLNTAQCLRLSVVDDHERLEVTRLAARRLRSQAWPHARSTAARIDDVVKTIDKNNGNLDASTKRQLLVLAPEALKLWLDHDNEQLEEAAETQRRTMWLVCVALGLVFALGLGGHREVLLIGAVGGFMVPFSRVRKRKISSQDYATSWGMLLLGPMAGALAAYVGLLLVRFLADDDINVLDGSLKEVWTEPPDVKTLAIAAALGFSAPLFGSLAAATSSKLLPTTSDADEEVITEDEEADD